MSAFVELQEGLFVRAEEVAAVKQSDMELDRCTVFLRGQSALDGFVVTSSAEDAIAQISAADGQTP